MFRESPVTFKSAATLEAHRRVKIDTSATTADPAKVIYAGAGEDYVGVTKYSAATGDLVAVDLAGHDGTLEITAKVGSAINVGTVLYGAASGKISDTSSGSGQGVALQVAAASGDNIEVAPWNVKSTTAATVSVADAGNFTAQTTVEAALQEIYKHLLNAEGFIPVSLDCFKTSATAFVTPTSALGTHLATDSTPKIGRINGATDPAQAIIWAAGGTDPAFAVVTLPPDLDDGVALVLHARIASNKASNTPTFTVSSYFNEGSTAVIDSLAAASATSTFSERTATIAAGDVPSGAQTLTFSLKPAAHANDIWRISALWFEYTRKLLTA